MFDTFDRTVYCFQANIHVALSCAIGSIPVNTGDVSFGQRRLPSLRYLLVHQYSGMDPSALDLLMRSNDTFRRRCISDLWNRNEMLISIDWP